MTNVKTALLSLAFLMSIVLVATAEEDPDWLVPGLSIADVEHTGEYLAKAGSASNNNTTIENIEGGIANLPEAPASREVYSIGGSTATAQPPAEETTAPSEPSDFSGRWSFAMDERTVRSLELALRQTGDLVFGKGVMGPSDGEAGAASSEDRGIESMIDWLNQPASALGTASQAAASGTVVGNEMKLNVVSLESIALYRFDLTLTGDLVSGGYTAYGSDGSTWSGTVTGSRAA
jgi:hypothetical protein